MGALLQEVAEDHANFESTIATVLGADQPIHNLITKDYPLMQKDKEQFRRKQKDLETAESRYNKEKQKRELAGDDKVIKKSVVPLAI